RLLRQLRFRWEDFSLMPQIGSTIAFPGISLRFNNHFDFFREEIHRHFPAEKDNFERLLAEVLDYDELDERAAGRSARAVVSSFLRDPLLIEMLFCPLLF